MGAGIEDYGRGLEAKFTILCTLLKINITYVRGLVASHVQKTNLLNQSVINKIEELPTSRGA